MDFEHISTVLGYSFQRNDLVRLALTHRSVGATNNERLEFLGDSLLNFIIAEALFNQFPDGNEGQLSRLRASLVKGRTLAELARDFDLGPHLLLGDGELRSGGQLRESILANAVEALIGALYLEAGSDVCRKCVLSWYDSRLKKLTLNTIVKDPKTRLQEYLQSRKLPLPVYEIESISGQAHAQSFLVHCKVDGLAKPTAGESGSRRSAEQQAAAQALIALGLEENVCQKS